MDPVLLVEADLKTKYPIWSIIWLEMKQNMLHTVTVACKDTQTMVAWWKKPNWYKSPLTFTLVDMSLQKNNRTQ